VGTRRTPGTAWLRRPGRKARAGADLPALEDLVVYVAALWVERRIARRGGPVGIVVTAAVTLYGAGSVQRRVRASTSQHWWRHRGSGSHRFAFVGGGAALAGWLLWRDRGVAHAAVTDPWRAPVAQCALDEDDDRALPDSPDSTSVEEPEGGAAVPEASDKTDQGERACCEPTAGAPNRQALELLDRQRGSTGRRSGSAIVTVG